MKELRKDWSPVNGWESFASHASAPLAVEAESFRRYEGPKSGLYEYRTVGTMPFPPERFVCAFHEDAFRTENDTSVKEQTLVGDVGGTSVIRQVLRFPAPLSNREYLYWRRAARCDSTGNFVVIGRACKPCELEGTGLNVPKLKKKRWRPNVNVSTYCSAMLVSALDGGRRCRFVYWYRDDPGGKIPKSVVNWCTTVFFPKQIEAFCTMSREYGPWARTHDGNRFGFHALPGHGAPSQGAKSIQEESTGVDCTGATVETVAKRSVGARAEPDGNAPKGKQANTIIDAAASVEKAPTLPVSLARDEGVPVRGKMLSEIAAGIALHPHGRLPPSPPRKGEHHRQRSG
jgi:hypothetical protein